MCLCCFIADDSCVSSHICHVCLDILLYLLSSQTDELLPCIWTRLLPRPTQSKPLVSCRKLLRVCTASFTDTSYQLGSDLWQICGRRVPHRRRGLTSQRNSEDINAFHIQCCCHAYFLFLYFTIIGKCTLLHITEIR